MGEKYGVTSKGFILRRFDTIYAELADKIKNYAGIDITANPDSALNLSLCYPFCDIVSQVHEENLDVYNSLHPSTAEGTALDDCGQFANIKRYAAKKSVYLVSCNVIDGNIIRKDTIIAANTNPRHDLYCDADTEVSRAEFNEAYIKPIVTAKGQTYIVTIDNVKHAYTAISGEVETILDGIKTSIGDGFKVSILDDKVAIKSLTPKEVHEMELSNNLTTDSITGLVRFSTQEHGAITLPIGTITVIISNLSTGFNWCENRINPELGRLAEEDWEYRQSYAERIYTYSRTMVDSIRSYLLNNVENITAVQVYENDTDSIDSEGRLPHSIEVVAEGGEDEDIAYAILHSRSGGIGTNGDVSVTCIGTNNESLVIKFNRPVIVYAWLRIVLKGDKKSIPKDYMKIVRDIFMDTYGNLDPGTSIILQEKIGQIYQSVSGIQYAYVYQYNTTDSTVTPKTTNYVQSNIVAKSKEMVSVSEDRIEVVIDEGS